MKQKTLQINIAVNDPYDTDKYGFNTVWSRTDHSLQC